MKERKFVKLRIDMYEDTKFKIIDTKPERDLIHYVWTRLLTLAGKVNLEGKLYMSKNIPYTVETLGIELNRSTIEIKLALKTFENLEMVELTEDKVYKIKNFAKHQNIEVNPKINPTKNELKKETLNEPLENNTPKSEKTECQNKDEKSNKIKTKTICEISKATDLSTKGEDRILNNRPTHLNIFKNSDNSNETKNKPKNQTTKKQVESKENHRSESIQAEPSPVNISPPINKKKDNKTKKTNVKNIKGINDIEMIEETPLITFFEGNTIPLAEGDRIVASWDLS